MTSRFSRVCDRHDGVVVGAEAEQVDRDDRLRLQAAFRLDRRNRGFEALDIDIVGVGVHVDEDRLGLGQRDDLGRGSEGEARHEHRVARSDAGRVERKQQRIGAVGAGNAMLDADIGRELGLELRDLRSKNVAAVLDDAVDGGLQPIADTLALRAQVDELHANLAITPISR